MSAKGDYYLPGPSPWPIVTSAGIFLLAVGLVLAVNTVSAGGWIMSAGAAVIAYMMIRWFGQVIGESEASVHTDRVERSYRLGMGWFIFSEAMFFAAFFGALFYVRMFSTEWLGTGLEKELLWPAYEGGWPTAGPGGPAAIAADTAPGANQFSPMGARGIPAVNTLILLGSSATVAWALWGLRREDRAQLITGLFMTVVLAVIFLSLQAYEYIRAYHELGLTLKAGVYGATFFMLTGFHGLHVMIGAIMLSVVLGRSVKGHFTAGRHFGLEGVAWYWYFVNLVWLCLFIFVYWL